MAFDRDTIITLIACVLVLVVLYFYNLYIMKKYKKEKEKDDSVSLEKMINGNYMFPGMIIGFVVGALLSFTINFLSISSCTIIGLFIGMCVGMFIRKKQ